MEGDLKHTPVPQNFVYPEIKDEHYRLGSLPMTVIREDADWRDFLPPEEDQNIRGIESSACYIEAQQHTIATLEEEIFGEKDNNYSSRFNALLSGGTSSGGDPLKGADSIRNDGLVKDSSMPFGDNINSWDDFHSWKGVDQAAVKAEGAKYLQTKELHNEIVFEKNIPLSSKHDVLRQALKSSPIPISVTAWYENNGVYYKPEGLSDNHLVEAVYMDDQNRVYIRDTYAPYLKILDSNFNFDFALRWTVQKKSEAEISRLQQIITWLRAILNIQTILNALNRSKMPQDAPQQPNPTPAPTPAPKPAPASKYNWSTPEAARHSVRLICDEEGLTVEQKNDLSRTIHCESGYHTKTVHPNLVNGKVASTDYGICQWNDYYHGKEISPHEAINNPEKAVRLMCKYVKRGQLNLWVCWSSGLALNYTP